MAAVLGLTRSSPVSSPSEENMSSVTSMSEQISSQTLPTEFATPLGTIGKLPIELRTMIYDLFVHSPVAPDFSFIAGRHLMQAGYSSIAALMACNSTLRTEIRPNLYRRREMAFIPRATGLDMHIDNIPVKISLDTIQSHLSELNLDTVTVCLESSLMERHHCSRLVSLEALISALNQASSIKCLHVRFATKYDPFSYQPPKIIRIIESYVSQLIKLENLQHKLKIYVHEMLPQAVADQNKCISEIRRVVTFRLKESLKALNRNSQVTEPSNVRSVFQQLSIQELNGMLNFVNGMRLYDSFGAHDCGKHCWTDRFKNRPRLMKRVVRGYRA